MDLLIADVIKKIQFLKLNVLYLLILHGDLSSNFVCSIVLQKSCIIQKIKNFYDVGNMFFKKTVFSLFKKNWRYRFF